MYPYLLYITGVPHPFRYATYSERLFEWLELSRIYPDAEFEFGYREEKPIQW